MRKFIVVLLIAVCCFSRLTAQTTEDSVKAVVNRLFEGMKSANPDIMKEVFADSAILQTIARSREGKMVIMTDHPSKFIQSVGSLKPGAADERIEFETVRIDGPLAIVWTPYQFYFDGKFSHCGVNSFQLVRLNGQWKIQYLIDTRRRTGCEGGQK